MARFFIALLVGIVVFALVHQVMTQPSGAPPSGSQQA